LGFEDVWEKKGIEIEADMEEQVLVKADPELLTLVWNNLFSNAIKFTEPGGKVRVTLNTQDEEAVVRISDTGCGISPEVGRHIFEKFYQGDTSHATKGNGLGLALVKRVMDITKGDIQVSSEVGKGSTFTVRIERERDGTV
jgi:signal transduction histidine kinase